MKSPGSKILAALATTVLLTSGGLSSVAHAIARDDVRSETVRFGDLNLAAPAGVQALYVRIQNAAHDVCGQANVPGTRRASVAWKDCVSDTLRQAILQVGNPSLSTYYANRLRGPTFTTKE